MLDPQMILGLLQRVSGAAKSIYDAVDRAYQLECEEQKAIQDLRQGVKSLKSDTMVYEVLITAMLNDGRPKAPSPFAILMNKCMQLTYAISKSRRTGINKKLRNNAQGHARGEPSRHSLRIHEESLRNQ
jgi:hypothetical protein